MWSVTALLLQTQMDLTAFTMDAHLGSLFVSELRSSTHFLIFICIVKSMTKLKVCLQFHVSGDVVCGNVSVCL